ncbi:hypothetical protein BEL04_17945 [Mucilaginibacter sp. PPCGB 2223]|uniref:hypothetical protein n=1 Tax=Mucilaginibacter sp. PPCGB 2223 TaxID=1886027 RepID=UPI000825156B|nr:hypothetical protein [Mucilaginibacter sp. PPCGB 2223]OCX51886.1 hypothetical protein BEL04_17945 [Mucilaginibacter sp. PPCGB 2223]
MKNLSLISIILLSSLFKNTQKEPFTYPTITSTGKTIAAFVPKGWKIKSKAIGDLNGDKTADIALILEYRDTVSEIRSDHDTLTGNHPRVLVVLFKNGDNYNLAIQQNTFILREHEGTGMGEDPYDEPEITKGLLIINFQLLREHLQYKFRYQSNDFYLIGAEDHGVDHNDLYGWSYNFLTKKAVHDSGESTENIKAKNKREILTIPFINLKKLSELKQPFQWEVLKDVFI